MYLGRARSWHTWLSDASVRTRVEYHQSPRFLALRLLSNVMPTVELAVRGMSYSKNVLLLSDLLSVSAKSTGPAEAGQSHLKFNLKP